MNFFKSHFHVMDEISFHYWLLQLIFLRIFYGL